MLLQNITRLCKEKGIAISRLERETGISNGTIGRWGSSSPSVENVRKVAQYFGTSVDALISENGGICSGYSVTQHLSNKTDNSGRENRIEKENAQYETF